MKNKLKGDIVELKDNKQLEKSKKCNRIKYKKRAKIKFKVILILNLQIRINKQH
jgi:hypothetical protein